MGKPRMIILIRHGQSEGNSECSATCESLLGRKCEEREIELTYLKKTEKSTKPSPTTA
jgi:hypothetical protein